MVARLVECMDHRVTYGILTVENVSADTVQEKISEIKKRFFDEEFDDWTIDDVLMELPDTWEWSYEQNVEIVEI